ERPDGRRFALGADTVRVFRARRCYGTVRNAVTFEAGAQSAFNDRRAFAYDVRRTDQPFGGGRKGPARFLRAAGTENHDTAQRWPCRSTEFRQTGSALRPAFEGFAKLSSACKGDFGTWLESRFAEA